MGNLRHLAWTPAFHLEQMNSVDDTEAAPDRSDRVSAVAGAWDEAPSPGDEQLAARFRPTFGRIAAEVAERDRERRLLHDKPPLTRFAQKRPTVTLELVAS